MLGQGVIVRERSLRRLHVMLAENAAAVCLVVLVAGDLLRRWSPGQSVLLSTGPLLIALAGALASLAAPVGRVGELISLSIFSLLSMCAWGTVSGYLQGLPPAQILAGWLAEAGAVPGLLIGMRAAAGEASWLRLWRVAGCLLAFSAGVAVLQQLGWVASEQFDMIEGAQRARWLSTGTRFEYIAGPFRTANVFSVFLATVGLLAGIRYAEDLPWTRGRASWLRIVVTFGVLFVCSLLAARRSGLVMLAAATLPWLFVLRGPRVLVGALAAGFAGLLVLTGELVGGSVGEDEIQAKVEFATSEAKFADRVADAFEIHDDDFRLLTFSGEGLGSYGPATRAAGEPAAERDAMLLERHPLLHVGWFKDLVALGPVGATLRLIWFGGIFLAMVRVPYANSRKPVWRYNVFAFFLAAVGNYYFVATSWMQGLAGGVLFGLAIGVALARIRRRVAAERLEAARGVAYERSI